MSRDPIKCMQKALDTFRERNKVYGDNYHQHGRVMMALFKEGVNLQTIEDYNRFGIVNMMVAKLTRYCQGWPKPHEDSVHDLFFELDHVGELTMDRFWSIELRPIRFEV